MIQLTRPLVTIDLETTGANPATDRIVEFAALKRFPNGERLSWAIYLNPGVPIPQEASDVHGITDAEVADCDSFADWADRIHRSLKDCDLAGFNLLNFDVPLLWEEFYRCGIEWDLSDVKILDVRNLWTKMEPRTLSGAVEKFLGKSHEGAHSAISDTIATADVLEAQIQAFGLEPSLDKLCEAAALDDRRFADVARKFYIGPDGRMYFNFGKHKDKPALAERGYLNWMMGADFPGSTKLAIQKLMGKLVGAHRAQTLPVGGRSHDDR